MTRINIAIISDLHCHHSRKFRSEDIPSIFSYLTSDLIRTPINKHPVQSLFKLMDDDPSITADFLLCPGDITNQVDVQGFISGWNYIKEIGGRLNNTPVDIIATLGNHDVDSRYNISKDNVFKIAQGIDRNFPFKNQSEIDLFYNKGFCFIEYNEIRFLVINTVKFHTSSDSAVYGKMEEAQLEEIQAYLSKQNSEKIQVALCHHHPIEHSRWELGTEDTILLGAQLIDVLNTFKFDILIHGHKHDPWLRYSHGNLDSLAVFSAGSFSSVTNQIATASKNTFHILQLTKEIGKKACGHIKTWEFLPSAGWRLADSGDRYFPQNTGFGYRGDIQDLVDKTENIINQGNGEFLNWPDFKAQCEGVDFLTPDDCLTFKGLLKEKGIITNPEAPKRAGYYWKATHEDLTDELSY